MATFIRPITDHKPSRNPLLTLTNTGEGSLQSDDVASRQACRQFVGESRDACLHAVSTERDAYTHTHSVVSLTD